MKAAKVPTVIIPRTTCRPPTTKTIMTATAYIKPMAGHRKLVIQINPLFFSTKSRFITSKRRHLRIFLAKGANHPHSRDVFAHPFRDLGIKRLDFLEALVNLGAEDI